MILKPAENWSWLSRDWSAPILLSRRGPGPYWYGEGKPDFPGVYRLVALDVINGKAKPLQRVCEIDETGTLYIGAAKNVQTAIYSLEKTYDSSQSHGRHWPMEEVLAKLFPFECLAASWFRVDSAEDVFDTEHSYVLSYKSRFGEPPPLNGYGGRRVLKPIP